HDAMWRAMGDGFKVPRERFQSPEPMIPQVQAFHGYLTEMCRGAEFGAAVSATNYAVEGMAQKISAKALQGLSKNERIGPRGRWWLEPAREISDDRIEGDEKVLGHPFRELVFRGVYDHARVEDRLAGRVQGGVHLCHPGGVGRHLHGHPCSFRAAAVGNTGRCAEIYRGYRGAQVDASRQLGSPSWGGTKA